MQKNKEVYERSILTVTVFETEDVITTSGPNLFEGLGRMDNESHGAGGNGVFPIR